MRFAHVVSGCAVVFAVASFLPTSASAGPESAPPASVTLAPPDLPEFMSGAQPVRRFRVAVGEGPLLINEILPGPARDWDGSGAFSSRDDEWVELVNAGASSVDLSQFLITDGDTLPRFAPSGTLAPGGHRFVTGKQSFDWEKANGFPSFGMSLGNSGDAVMLWRTVAGDTTLVDVYTYTSHEAAADRSIGRLPDGGPAWALFDGLDPYTGTIAPQGNGCAPSPDATNLCGTTQARPGSWGRLKTLYQ